MGSAYTFAPETGDWVVADSVAGLGGVGGEVACKLFWNLSTGVRFSAKYYHLWSIDDSLSSEGFTAPERFQYAEAQAGLVFRL
jgi:hypothetical protein